MNNDEDSLADLLVRWEELQEQGQDVSAIELCQQAPHLADELARRIRVLKDTAWLDRRFDADTDTDATSFETKEKRTLADRYRLDELVAEGGFAQVWKAFDLELHRSVAIKLPKPSRLASSDAFMAEARRVARLKHPGIVPVHDVGRDNGNCFIVSEFIEGGNLASQMTGGALPHQKAARWAVDIADALQYAHANGIIHRDIKPANILIDHHGRALLADFGIAQSANKTGMFAPSIGTLRYMSPEQLAGKESDVRSDIYSLGVVLHELLTGKLPYSSDLPTVLKQEIVSGATVSLANVPPELKRICAKALELNPQDRYASADAFASDLRKNFEKPKRPGIVLGVVPAVLVLLFGLFSILPKTLPKQQTQSGPKPIDAIWLTKVEALPVEEQIKEVVAKLQELNPGFDGDIKTNVFDDVVNLVEMRTDNVTDITPLRAFQGLRFVNLSGTFTWKHNGKLSDLTPLKGMKLEELAVHSTKVRDISPLEGMPLRILAMQNTLIDDLSPLSKAKLTEIDTTNSPVSDLTPLAGMPLTSLLLGGTKVEDLSPLVGIPLQFIRMPDTKVSDIGPLKGMPLIVLACNGSEVSDLSPLRGNSVMRLFASDTMITDWSPLKDMPQLKSLTLDFVKERDLEILRAVKTLDDINQKTREQFWQEVEKPANAEEAIAIGNLYFNQNQFERAAQSYTTAIEFDSANAKAIHRRGECAYKLEKYQDGIGDFRKAVELQPNNVNYLQYLAMTLFFLQQFDESIEIMERMIAVDPPEVAQIKSNLAVIYTNRALKRSNAKEFPEAILDISRALEINPDGRSFYRQRASSYFNNKQYDLAITDFTEAIRREPNIGSNYLNRGYCYQLTGKDQEAADDFARAKELEVVK